MAGSLFQGTFLFPNITDLEMGSRPFKSAVFRIAHVYIFPGTKQNYRNYKYLVSVVRTFNYKSPIFL